MCTVTFIPVGDKIFITSNRDESNNRKQAFPPAACNYKDSQLIFPRDAEAGGTWIAINTNGNVAVLLNGAFKKFVPQPFYINSRGLILLEVIADPNPAERFEMTDLHLTAPFTLVTWQHQALFECRWDGNKKHIKKSAGSEPHIWSSTTLYNQESIRRRQQWLDKFLCDTPAPVMKDIVNFHLLAGAGDPYDSLRMSRDGMYATVSITSIECGAAHATMFYHDCKDESDHQQIIKPFPHLASRFIPYDNNKSSTSSAVTDKII